VVPRTSPVSRMPWLSRNCLTFTSCTAAGGGGGVGHASLSTMHNSLCLYTKAERCEIGVHV
jgi:hypothetical protein